MSEHKTLPGGSFLVHEATPEEIYTPEDFTSEQLMYAKTARDFVEREVLPVMDDLEAKKPGVAEALMAKAGEIGLLMADVPEAYGGLALDKPSSALIAENISGSGSYSVIQGAHVGIGTLPIVYYGTEAAKKKYLPGLADGTKIGCYCLTEPSAGSDALSGRAKAVLSDDGKHYLITGSKQYITNGGIADVFIVFAKVDGEHFTGFVCEKGQEGLTVGPEEHKMGIVGSSTTPVNFDEVKVPLENVLGEVGKGHKIAFNALNIGRFKLGVGCAGGSKRVTDAALQYAMERKQFGKPIAEFGMIREKLANMYARTYALESACYRTVGQIEAMLENDEDEHASLKAIEEYSIECAITKVEGSETLDYCVDEEVQILGGYGYCAEYPAERHYRDSRINRIFEGTNEINRLLIPAMLLRKGMKGEIPLFQAATKLQEELMDIPSLDFDEEEGVLVAEGKVVENLKKICLFTAGFAAQKYGKKLEEHQELLSRAADLCILAFLAESTRLRALKDYNNRGDKAALPVAAAGIICEKAISQADQLAREAISYMTEGDVQMTMLAALRRLTRRTPADTLTLRETITAKMVDDERTPFLI